MSSQMVFLHSDFPTLTTFSYHLVLEALNVEQLVHDVNAVVKNPLQHCPTCLVTTTAGRIREHTRHTVYIEGTMILDIR